MSKLSSLLAGAATGAAAGYVMSKKKKPMDEKPVLLAGPEEMANGGIVGKTSRAMEAVGKALGTDKGRKIKEAEKFLAEGRGEDTRHARDRQINDAEERAVRGYADGGMVGCSSGRDFGKKR